MYILRMLVTSWLVTVIVEEAIAAIWGCRGKDLLTVLWVNTVTNPAVTGLRLLMNQTVPSSAARTVLLIIIEAAVLIAEWRLFRYFISGRRNYFLFSLSLNAASYGAGLLMPAIMRMITVLLQKTS